MSNQPNGGCKGRWVVQGREARHGPSGLVVSFRRTPTDDGWDGEPTNGETVAQALIAAHGFQEASRMLTRLMREAGDIFQERHHE